MLEIIFEAIFQAVTAVTGHVVLKVLTLGRWRLTEERCDLASGVGLVFWLLVGVAVYIAFFR